MFMIILVMGFVVVTLAAGKMALPEGGGYAVSFISLNGIMLGVGYFANPNPGILLSIWILVLVVLVIEAMRKL